MHLLLALNFLKEDDSENSMSLFFHVDEKTIRKYVRHYVGEIASLNLIRLSDRFSSAPSGCRVLFSIDGTHCPIKEPSRPLDKAYYSHKIRRSALVYEVGLSIHEGRIVWVAGGVPAGTGDLDLSRATGILEKIGPNEMIVADKGYRDDDTIFLTAITGGQLNHEEKKYNTWLRQILARQEIVNKRLKHFGVLCKLFRHDEDFHPLCFKACAMITQTMLVEEPLHSL